MNTHTQELSDEELVTRAQATKVSDLEVFDELVDRHHPRVLATCRAMTRFSADSEDLAQDVLVKTLFALPSFEGRSTFKTWMNRISVNHCLNYLAESRGKTFVDVEDPSLLKEQKLQIRPRADINVQASTDRKRINLVLASMSDTLRAPLVLRDAGGYSYQEIADHLGIGLSAAKMRIKRGREQFRQHWQETMSEPRIQTCSDRLTAPRGLFTQDEHYSEDSEPASDNFIKRQEGITERRKQVADLTCLA